MSALTNCPSCSKQVSESAETCPHCGHRLKQSVSVVRIAALLFIVIAIGLIYKALQP